MGHACGKVRTNNAVFSDTIIDTSRIEKGELYKSNKLLSLEEIQSLIESSKSQLRISPLNYPAHLNIGICLYYLGYTDAAESHLIKSRQLNKSFDSSYLLGLIYLTKNDLKQAQSSFQNSISESATLSVYIKLGEVLLRRNKPSHARKYAKQGLSDFPNNPDLLSLIGMSYMSTNPLKANKYCSKAIKADPKLFKPYINVADIHKALGKLEHAEEMYKKAAGQGNQAQKGFAQMMLSLLYFEIGNLPKAISYCNKSIESNPCLEELMLKKGFDVVLKNQDFEQVLALIQRKNFEVSARILKRLYKKNKKSIPVCFFLASCYLNLDKCSKSKRFFKKVVRLAEFMTNNEVNALFVNRSECVLATQFSDNSEGYSKDQQNSEDAGLDEELGEVEQENLCIEGVGEEDKLVLTEEGNYPNFQETLKENVMDEGVSEIKVESLPVNFIPRNIKSNALRQFAKSADPEPDKNCLVF